MAANARGAALGISALLLLSSCTVSRAVREQALDLLHRAAEEERLPLCARQIVAETCKAAGSALELVSAATGSSHDEALPVLERLGLARDASCQSVCAAVTASIPSAVMPAFSDQGCRYDFAASKVACDVDFRTVHSEVLPAASLAESAKADSEEEEESQEPAPEELKHHRPLLAAQRPGARKNATRRPPPVPSQPQTLLQIARLFRIYPYGPSTAGAALLEAAPVPMPYGHYAAPSHVAAPGRVFMHPQVHGGVPQRYQGVPQPHQGVPQPHQGMYAGNVGAQKPPVHHQPQPHQGVYAGNIGAQQPPVHHHPAPGEPHVFGNPLHGHVRAVAQGTDEDEEEDEGPSTPTVDCPSCHSNDLRKIEETRALAQRMMVAAITALRTGSSDLGRHMQTYFGADTNEARKTVMSMLYRTNIMLNGKLQYDTTGEGCEWDVLAWVYPEEMTDDEQMYIIHLCRGFFRGVDLGNLQGLSSNGRKGVRAYTLIHELTHHLLTDDVCVDLREGDCGWFNTAYGTAKCRRLAARSPEKALENADSYALFVEKFLQQ